MIVMVDKPKRGAVNVWCDTLFGFYSVKPLVGRLLAAGVRVVVHAPAAHHRTLSAYLGVPPEDLLCLKSRHPLRDRLYARLEGLFTGLFVSTAFSPMYARVREKEGRWMRLAARLLPKAKDPNRAYRMFFRAVAKDLLPPGPVLAVTRVTAPYWLAASRAPIHALMESWDHPVKTPFFHRADTCHAWNADLLADIRAHQGIVAEGQVYPMKFRYLHEIASLGRPLPELVGMIRNPAWRRHLEELPRQPFLTYVATTQMSNKAGYEGEMHLMRQLAQWAETNGTFLYVKPKPNGREGEYDSLARPGKVAVGIYGDSESSQMLDPDYHLYRYCLLKMSSLVVNVGTTFALEAALAGTPIVQLKIGRDYPFPYFRDLCANPHIQKYLNRGEHYEYDGSRERLDAILADALAPGSSRARRFTEATSRWLSGGTTPEASTDRLFNLLVADMPAGVPAGSAVVPASAAALAAA